MKRNSLKQRNIINIMRSYGETQVLTTKSSISVNAARGVQRGAPPPLVAAVSEADVRRRRHISAFSLPTFFSR